MKIVHAVVSLDPNRGGPPKVVANLAAAQARLGHDVSILTQEMPDQMDRVQGLIAETPGGADVRLRVVPPASKLWHLLSPRPDSRFEPEIRVTQVLHLHGVWDPFLLPVARYARWLGRPYILTPHGMLDPWSLRQRRVKKRLAMAMGYGRLINRAAALHVLNEDERGGINRLRVRPRLVIIPNAVSAEEIAGLPPRGRFRARFPQLADRPFVLFLSRLHYKKGLDILGDAFSQVAATMPEVDLVVAGPDGGAGTAFRQQIKERELEHRVHLVGPIFGEAKYEALVDAACFCLPSRQEGFSIAILEAMGAGLPVVISDQCHFPEVASARAGHVVSLSGSAVGNALLNVLSATTDEQRDMGAAGHRLVEEQYTWKSIAQRSLAVYEQLLQNKAREESST